MTSVALSYPFRRGPRCELCEWLVRSVALYGVRVRRIGEFFAPLGTRMTVCSFTPSRMGIMISRRVYSKLSVTGSNLAGVSLGKLACEAGGGVPVWAADGSTNNRAPSIDAGKANRRTQKIGFIRFPQRCGKYGAAWPFQVLTLAGP